MNASVPPKVVSLQARSQAQAIDSHRPGALDRSMEGLPVLQAFQQFLEAERRRARNRGLVLLGISTVALLIVAAISAVVGTYTFRRMADQVSAVELDMRAIKHETLAVRNEALDARRRTEATLADVQQRAQSMQDARVDVVAGSVASLQGDLEALRSRDSELSRELSTVRDVLPALSGDLGLVVDLLETIRLDARRPATPNPAAMRDSISMVIMPRGWDEPVPWRLPIPE